MFNVEMFKAGNPACHVCNGNCASCPNMLLALIDKINELEQHIVELEVDKISNSTPLTKEEKVDKFVAFCQSEEAKALSYEKDDEIKIIKRPIASSVDKLSMSNFPSLSNRTSQGNFDALANAKSIKEKRDAEVRKALDYGLIKKPNEFPHSVSHSHPAKNEKSAKSKEIEIQEALKVAKLYYNLSTNRYGMVLLKYLSKQFNKNLDADFMLYNASRHSKTSIIRWISFNEKYTDAALDFLNKVVKDPEFAKLQLGYAACIKKEVKA